MKITFAGDEYDLDILRAKELGVLTRLKKKRQIKYGDLKNGDIFKFRNLVNNTPEWEREIFKAIDIDKESSGQCIALTSMVKLETSTYRTWFATPNECVFAILQDDGGWKTEIEY